MKIKIPRKLKPRKETRLSYAYLLKWVCLALVSGIVSSLVVRSFHLFSSAISSFLLSFEIPVPVWTLAGAIVAGGVIYRLQPHAAGEGIPSYLRGLRIYKGDLLFSVTFYKYWAALATLSTFGNGGIVGPLGRVSAGLMARLEKPLNNWNIGFSQEDQRTAAICGMAAAVGSIFHTSIGGGIFAVEIIQRAKMGYKDMFPAILSSSTAVFVCKGLGWKTFYSINAVDSFMDTKMIGWLVLLSILAGLLGGFYTTLYKHTARLIRRKEGNVLLKVMGGSAIASLVAWSINPELLGTSKNIISSIFTGDYKTITGNLHGFPVLPITLLAIILLKAICNCVTVGSGMSAGFTGPAITMGMLLGCTMARLLGIPGGTPTFDAFIAAGFSGMLAGSMNIPLAASVMGIEIFGLNYSLPSALAAIIAFQINRHRTIYDYALAGAGLDIDEE